ncbi:MAG: DUF4202 domain-containing protein [Chitinophagaceae bacterium]
MNKFQQALELFDNYNKQDPRFILWEGVNHPTEYFYALQLYNWVTRLEPGASESLLLAARSQHIGRWKSPRDNYPQGKAGYLRWRSELRNFHAETAAALMLQAGFDDEAIRAVQKIILKEQLKYNHEVQVMEDALCLVFLQFQYIQFVNSHEEDKVVRVLKKTLQKMSRQGRDAALLLEYDEAGKALLGKALAL